VEFIHHPKMSTFNQRELGSDFKTFSEGLRSALRQAPKCILVGEMRDRETVEMALSAAETGHLVFSTLHTVDAGTTVNRIVGLFDHDEEKLIRVRLADTLRWVVSQRLLPKIGGGRVAALEIMGASLLIKDIITNGESPEKTFYGAIESMKPLGFQTFDQHILELFKEKLITEDTAKTFSSKKTIMSRGIDNLKALAGESELSLDNLELEPSEPEEEPPASNPAPPSQPVQSGQAGAAAQYSSQSGAHPNPTPPGAPPNNHQGGAAGQQHPNQGQVFQNSNQQYAAPAAVGGKRA
jgi:twitching motility protein PilT